MRILLTALLLGCLSCALSAQQLIALSDAIMRMDTTHPALKAADLRIQKQETLKPAAVNLPNPQLLFQAPTGDEMRPSILWTTEFPGVYVMQHKEQDQRVDLAATERKMKLNELKYELSAWYFEIQYLDKLISLMQKQDSAYAQLVELNKSRPDRITALDRTQAETQYAFYHGQLVQVQMQKKNAVHMFNRMIGAANDSSFVPQPGFTPLLLAPALVTDTLNAINNPSAVYYNQQITLAQTQVKTSWNRAMPGLMTGYFNQGPDNSTSTYYRLNFGITIPLFFWQYSADIKASKQQVEIAELDATTNAFNLQMEYAKAQEALAQSATMMNYYTSSGLLSSAEVLRTADVSYRAGAINQLEYLRSLEQANTIERGYIESIFNYNKAALYIQFLNGFTN
jgi:outer membrane protein, heavy metal efflux system